MFGWIFLALSHELNMASPTHQFDERSNTGFRWIGTIFGIGVIVAEIVGVYVLLLGSNLPGSVVYGGTIATGIVVGGSSLYVVGQRVFASDSPGEGDKRTRTRLAEVIVSITVLTGVTVLLGALGGLALTILANLGGPDPETVDGDPFRERLLHWPQQNREFMKHNGNGRLPLTP